MPGHSAAWLPRPDTPPVDAAGAARMTQPDPPPRRNRLATYASAAISLALLVAVALQLRDLEFARVRGLIPAKRAASASVPTA